MKLISSVTVVARGGLGVSIRLLLSWAKGMAETGLGHSERKQDADVPGKRVDWLCPKRILFGCWKERALSYVFGKEEWKPLVLMMSFFFLSLGHF